MQTIPLTFTPHFVSVTDHSRNHDYTLAYNISQSIIFLSLFWSSFGSFISYIPLLAPALLLIGFIISIFVSPYRLRFAAIPFSIVFVMALIDLLFHYPDVETLKLYFYWAVLFASFCILHRDPGFLPRCSILIVIFILIDLLFVSKDPANGRLFIDSSYGLSNLTNSNDLADSCAFAMLFSLCAFSYSHFTMKVFYSLTAVSCAIVLLGTVSRGGLIITTLSLFLYIILASKNIRALVTFLIISCLFALSYFTFSYFINSDISMYEQRFQREGPRGGLLQLGLRVVVENPLIGTGINDVESNTVRRNSPHNFFLAIGVHYGLAPALLMALLWIITLKRTLTLYFSQKIKIWGELLVLIFFFFCISCISNMIMLYSFCTLYMSKIISASDPY
ncbi:MAG: O-antigen ligase family protein [Syntrophobacteraceae bacterium]